ELVPPRRARLERRLGAASAAALRQGGAAVAQLPAASLVQVRVTARGAAAGTGLPRLTPRRRPPARGARAGARSGGRPPDRARARGGAPWTRAGACARGSGSPTAAARAA